MGQTATPPHQRLVGYHIRYDRRTVGKNSKIIFATDGILLREVTSDLLLRKYSVVILDEAHGNSNRNNMMSRVRLIHRAEHKH